MTCASLEFWSLSSPTGMSLEQQEAGEAVTTRAWSEIWGETMRRNQDPYLLRRVGFISLTTAVFVLWWANFCAPLFWDAWANMNTCEKIQCQVAMSHAILAWVTLFFPVIAVGYLSSLVAYIFAPHRNNQVVYILGGYNRAKEQSFAQSMVYQFGAEANFVKLYDTPAFQNAVVAHTYFNP